MIRVVIVDADRSLHRGLRMRLDREPDIRVVANADNVGAAAETIASSCPDIVLVDPMLLGLDPAVAVRNVVRTCAGARVVILSLHDDGESRDRAMAAGATAFVSKHERTERLLEVIRRVAQGDDEP